MENLYSDIYRTLMKEIKENTGEKMYYPHGLEGLILLKRSQYPKQFTDFNAIPIKIQYFSQN